MVFICLSVFSVTFDVSIGNSYEGYGHENSYQFMDRKDP